MGAVQVAIPIARVLIPILQGLMDGTFGPLEDAMTQTAKTLLAALPVKADGTAWTIDDLHALARVAELGFVESGTIIGRPIPAELLPARTPAPAGA